MEKTLDKFKKKEKGRVIKIVAEDRLKRRLFDMGITPNVYIIFKKTSPLGDPIEINVRGYELSLRKSEAQSILMEVEA